MTLEINGKTGDVTLGGYKVTLHTTPDELPAYFQIGEEFEVQIIKNKVPCIFATTTIEEENLTTKIDLRFENKALVSIFVELADKNKTYGNASEYYESTDERELLHLTWLKSKLGKKQSKYTTYKWGKAGVAQDKSAGVHIFLHNSNNSWAT